MKQRIAYRRAKTILKDAPLRVGSDGETPEIFHENTWLPFGRVDELGEVYSMELMGNYDTLDELRAYYLQEMLFGAEINDGCFYVIDSATDG